jgi:beta-phosphoglucomutase-like phosphatase (HAD superfamily)
MRELLGDVDPSDVLVFEDTEAGIASAKAAGAGRVLAITGTLDPKRLREADELIDRIDVELMQRILD